MVNVTTIPGIRQTWPQWLAGITTTFLLIEVGLIGAWSSPYVVKLTAEDSTLPLTEDEGSWVAALVNMSRLIGGIAGAIGCQMLGSKMTNLLSVVPAAFCWTFMIIANSATWLYVARLFGGLTLGMAFSCFPLYLGEISHPKIRGAIVALAITGTPIGNALISLIGSMFDIVQSSVAFLIGSVVLIAVFAWLPESPHHLIKHSKTQKARHSIAWYQRGCDVDREYTAIDEFVTESCTMTIRECLGEFRRPEIQKATFIISALNIFMQMSGLNNVVFYMATILTQAKVTIVDPAMCATIVMMFGVVSSIISLNLTDRLGRRVLLICSSLVSALALVALQIHFTLLEADYDPASLQWLPITALICSQMAMFFGVIPVPSTVLSELFPPNIKCIASCFAGIVTAISGFICTKTYQPLVILMGQQYVYWIYIAIGLLAIPFAIFIMPETKGKSLQQIQADLIRGKKKKLSSEKA